LEAVQVEKFPGLRPLRHPSEHKSLAGDPGRGGLVLGYFPSSLRDAFLWSIQQRGEKAAPLKFGPFRGILAMQTNLSVRFFRVHTGLAERGVGSSPTFYLRQISPGDHLKSMGYGQNGCGLGSRADGS
jgi:hypothetical protein